VEVRPADAAPIDPDLDGARVGLGLGDVLEAKVVATVIAEGEDGGLLLLLALRSKGSPVAI
jgi:hypothetical protein